MKRDGRNFRQKFREAEARQSEGRYATDVLSRFRCFVSPDEYEALMTSFRVSAPRSYQNLVALGPRSTSELVWVRGALEPLSLSNELKWAKHWLKGLAPKLNAFRARMLRIQQLVLAGNISTSITELDEYVRAAGWSLWAVELRAALLQMAEGTSSQRAWLTDLQNKTINSIPGLLYQVFGDRNDDTFSYDAVYEKCMNSFPRFESLAPWLVDYLKFRALAHVEKPSKALPGVLARDITSSLIDYYESIIETLCFIESDASISDSRTDALSLIDAMLDFGYLDGRLTKLRFGLSGVLPAHSKVIDGFSSLQELLYLGKSNSIVNEGPTSKTFAELERCRAEGAAAYDVVGDLLKWGVNLKGLDIGGAVAMTALYSSTWQPDSPALPFSVYLVDEMFNVHDIAAVSSQVSLVLKNTYFPHKNGTCENDTRKEELTSRDIIDRVPTAGPLHLWFARHLLNIGDYGELREIVDYLRRKGSYWERQCEKIEIIALCKRGDLASAFTRTERWLRKSDKYALEFPCDYLFENRKWASLKQLDVIEVGLVAHYVYGLNSGSSIGYICKMACRTFLQSGMREQITSLFDAANGDRKEQIIAFLRDVWVEQNLSLCHEFESTAQVRVERMQIMQLLIVWDSDNAAEYAQAIKDLTFDQTVQRGLEHIDQTRVFVNESAISRWAEKELLLDFERWRKLTESSSGGRAVDDMLRQYALDPTNVEVLKEFADGKPTAADALLIDIIDRLYKRFLLDPTDGLDTYLSVRVRHGSLRGTILGPLEEQGLLYSASGFSQEAFAARWNDVLRLPEAENSTLLGQMESFSKDVRAMVDEFVSQKVQIARPEKPQGVFALVFAPLSIKFLAAILAERPPSFSAFLACAYFVFWKRVEIGLTELRAFIDDELSSSIRHRIEDLILRLRASGARYLPLVTTLTTVLTTTKSQCDTVSEWFRFPSVASGEQFQLPDAIEIASVSTKNVHRAFSATVEVVCVPARKIPLTTSGLAVLTDCLFVVFENAWKHSGLGSELSVVSVSAAFDPLSRLLTIEVRSALSEARRTDLVNGELGRLRTKYLGEFPLELISSEGGSGFPKLARLTRSVPREECSVPFDFGVDSDWYTRVTVPLYEREGAYEAYE